MRRSFRQKVSSSKLRCRLSHSTDEEPQVIDLTSIPSSEDEAISSDEDNSTLVMIGDIPFREREQSILLNPSEWLTDEIINAFGTRLMQNAGLAVHCCSSFFFSHLLLSSQGIISLENDESAMTTWLQRWRQSWELDTRTRLILVPINWNNSHWALAAYDRESGLISYYDSLMSSARGRRALSLLCDAFSRCQLLPVAPTPPLRRSPLRKSTATRSKSDQVGVLAFIISKLELDNQAKNGSGDTNPLIKTEIPSRQCQQRDGSSCGVFVCWRMQQLVNQHLGRAGSKEDGSLVNPVAFRQKIFATIIKDHNSH